MLLLPLVTTALAGPMLTPPSDDELDRLEEAELDALEAADQPRVKRERPERTGAIKGYELAFRGRHVTVPRGLMNIWFHGAKDAGWPLADADRPFVHAGVYGLDLTLLGRKNTSALVYVEAFQSFTKEGYWDDREDGVQHYEDGRYIRPGKFFGAVIFGANGTYDAEIVKPSTTDGKFSMGFQVGGGLGIAVIAGHLDSWTIDTTNGRPAYLRKDEVAGSKLDLRSPIYPVPDLNLGFRFTFADVVTLRLEGGLHGGLYYGGSLGGRF